jgi:UDP-glucose 6-dehydrogenase
MSGRPPTLPPYWNGWLLNERSLRNCVDNEHPALVTFIKYQNIDKLTRDILIDLAEHIKVYENGNISVKVKFADELRRIAEYIEISTSTLAEALKSA